MTLEYGLAIVGMVFASTGFWTFITTLWLNKHTRKSSETKLLIGLAYRSICELAQKYIDRGYVSREEYQDLVRYLYGPYKEMGGDGTIEHLIEEVKELPVRGEVTE